MALSYVYQMPRKPRWVSVTTTAAICTLHLIESLAPLSFYFSFLFFLREENCGKYFVFPGSQAMYLLQLLLNEL